MDLPRLFIATEFPPNAPGGGPAVVRQMLKGYPPEKISWWSCLPEPAHPIHGQRVGRQIGFSIPHKMYPRRRLTKIRALCLENLWAPLASRDFRKQLLKEREASLWIIPHGFSILPLASVLCNSQESMPFRPYHITLQDYPGIHDQANQLGLGLCSRLSRQVDNLYTSSTTREATSHPMRSDLAERLHINSQRVLHAGLESEQLTMLEKRCAERSNAASTNGIRIVHAGSILAPEAFCLFVRALAILRTRISQPLSFELYGSHPYRTQPWFDQTFMVDHGEVGQDELVNLISQCSWGFAPMKLDDSDPRYNRFSFPTKFISYLSAGLPVIGVGHSSCSLRALMGAYSVGVFSDAIAPEQLAEELISALQEPAPSAKYATEILRCAREEFDAEGKRRSLWSDLQNQLDYGQIWSD